MAYGTGGQPVNPSFSGFDRSALNEDGKPISAGFLTPDNSGSADNSLSIGHNYRPRVISSNDIVSLTRWARVAFAARCARRVLPLYRHFHTNATRDVVKELLDTVTLTEQAATDGSSTFANEAAQYARQYPLDMEASQSSYLKRRAEQYSWYINDENHNREWHIPCAVTVSHIVWRAARVSIASDPRYTQVREATQYWHHAEYSPSAALNDVELIANATYSLLVAVAALGTLWNLAYPSLDLDELLAMSGDRSWTDDTPVPPSVLGPFWKGSPPTWWRDEAA
jgi:hypothetical protein